MKLYNYWRSSSSWRVRAVLAQKQLDYEYVPIQLLEQQQESESYAAVNPQAQVPTLEFSPEETSAHGLRTSTPFRITQSVAIAELLEELFPMPALLPESPWARALVRQVVEVVNAGTQPLQNLRVLHNVTALQSKEAADQWARDAIFRGLSAVEHLIAPKAGDFAAGNALTLADAFLVPQVYNARRFGVDLGPVPTVVRVTENALTHPAVKSSHPDLQPDATQSASTKN